MVFMLCSLESLWGVALQGSGQAPYSPPSLLVILHGLTKPAASVQDGADRGEWEARIPPHRGRSSKQHSVGWVGPKVRAHPACVWVSGKTFGGHT